MAEISQGTSEKRLVKKIEYARHRNVSPSLVTRWIAAGKVVVDGKRIDLEASDRLLAGSLDQSRGGKGGVPAAKRGGKDAQAPESAPAAAPSNSQSYMGHRARREDFVAREAELRYLERAGALVPKDDFVRAVRDGMVPIKAALDSLAPRIARRVLGKSEVREIEAAIETEIESIAADLQKALRMLLSEPGAVRQ